MFKTVTYDRFKRSVTANTTEKDDSKITPLLNDSIRYAYESNKYWPRYLNVTLRSISRGYVDFSEDSFFVYGAGDGVVNGLYVRRGDSNGKPRYSKMDAAGALFDIAWDGAEWRIVAQDYITVQGERVTVNGNYLYGPGDVAYDNVDTGSTPPTSGWAAGTGTEPAPLLIDVPDIGTPIQVWTADPNGTVSSTPCKFYTDGSGIRVPKVVGDLVWVAYKADLDTEYGDGTGGTSEAIPQEFAEYAKYDVSYQLQFNNRQSQPNQYPFAYKKVTDRLDVYLLQITEETGHRMIRDRFETYYGSDVSVRI